MIQKIIKAAHGGYSVHTFYNFLSPFFIILSEATINQSYDGVVTALIPKR